MERANVKKHEGLLHEEIASVYMLWYPPVPYLWEQGKFGEEGKKARLRSNRYKEESFPRTKSIPPPPPK